MWTEDCVQRDGWKEGEGGEEEEEEEEERMAQVRDVYKAAATYTNPSSVIMLKLLFACRACYPILECAR